MFVKAKALLKWAQSHGTLLKHYQQTTYTESWNTLDDREDHNYEENEGATKLTGLYLRKLEQRCMKEQREMEENHLAQPLPWLINNTHLGYDSPTNNYNEKTTVSIV